LAERLKALGIDPDNVYGDRCVRGLISREVACPQHDQ
jgi:hypothetical protein